MKLLFLDDDVKRWEKFSRNTIGHNRYYVRTPAECIKALSALPPHECYDIVFLDYDMDEVGGTSENVILYLETNKAKLKKMMKCVIHSLNEQFAPQLVERLYKAGYEVIKEPFAWDKETFLEGITK